MSELFRWYLGGLLATAGELSLLFAPERQQLQAVPARQLGADRRSAGTSTTARSASASSATAQRLRVESRIPGADVNSYHAFAATIAGGLHGIAERIEPPPPFHGNGYTDRRPAAHPGHVRRGDRAAGATATIARACFGDDVHHHVLHHAELEWAAFNRAVTDWERARYFERI